MGGKLHKVSIPSNQVNHSNKLTVPGNGGIFLVSIPSNQVNHSNAENQLICPALSANVSIPSNQVNHSNVKLWGWFRLFWMVSIPSNQVNHSNVNYLGLGVTFKQSQSLRIRSIIPILTMVCPWVILQCLNPFESGQSFQLQTGVVSLIQRNVSIPSNQVNHSNPLADPLLCNTLLVSIPSNQVNHSNNVY